MAIRTKTQLESDKNTLLADASDITAAETRSLIQNLIDSLELVIQESTYADMLAIASPTQGQKLYVTDFHNKELFIYNGTYWKPVSNEIVVDVKTTEVATGANTTLTTFAVTKGIGANYLLNDGDYAKIKAFGTFGTNTNDKTLFLYFGITEIYSETGGSDGYIGGTWTLDATVIRTGANAQKCIVEFKAITENNSFGNSFETTYSEITENMAASSAVQIKGQNGTASANDIVFEGIILTLHRL